MRTWKSGHGYWALRRLEELYAANDGFVDCHRHIDRHDCLDDAGYRLLADEAPLEKKWEYIDRQKASAWYRETMHARQRDAVQHMQQQGIRGCRTYIDVDEVIGVHGFLVAEKMRSEARAHGFHLQLAAYPIKGLGTSERRTLFFTVVERADLIGTLPSRDRHDIGDTKTVTKNLREYFDIAMRFDKPIDMQIDQKNSPLERESEVLVKVARRFRERGYTQRITATHCTSLGAQSLAHIKLIAKWLRELDISVVVCPGANVSTKEDRFQIGPIRNAIAPVKELLGEGVNVALGTDNVSDIFMPYCDGDFRAEVTKLADAIRWQGDLEVLAGIATTNGRKALGI